MYLKIVFFLCAWNIFSYVAVLLRCFVETNVFLSPFVPLVVHCYDAAQCNRILSQSNPIILTSSLLLLYRHLSWITNHADCTHIHICVYKKYKKYNRYIMFLSNLVKRIMCNIIKNNNLFFYAELKFNHKILNLEVNFY